jgi:four helix bundle protein
MRRSAVSIPSNIAEGHGRLTVREYRQFLGISRGSNFELQTYVLSVLGDSKLIDETESISHEVGKIVYAILRKIGS